MAVKLGDAVLFLSGDDKRLKKDIDSAEKHTKSWAEKLGSGLSGAVSFGLKGLVIGAGAAIAGLAGLGAALGDAVKSAAESEQITAQLNAVLASTGGVAGVTAEMAIGLADSLSKVTTFEDDAIVSGENLLLTFTNIGKDVFPQATKTMLDMSQALGQDMKSSATMLGKALQDPIAGVSALSRVGVNFTEQQKEQIKAMVEAGDVAGAQALILKELQVEFGGAAEAAGGTFAGKLTILNNQIGNVKETIGAALLPVLTDLMTRYGPQLIAMAEAFSAWFQEYGIPLLQEFTKWMEENLPGAMAFAADVWETVLQPALIWLYDVLMESVIPAISDLYQWLKVKVPIAFAAVVQFYQQYMVPFFAGMVGAWDKIADAIGYVIDKIKQAIDWFKRIPDAVPDWLIPGSPTPFEMGLRGIADAMSELSGARFGMNGNMAAAGAGTYNITINAPGGDPQAVRAAAYEGVTRAARAVGLR